MLVYVTSLYAVRKEYLPVLHQNFQQLIPHLRAPTYVFTDQPVPFVLPAHIHILSASLSDFSLYNACMGAGRLPQNRNAEKDTREFMALMNAKLDMMVKAMDYIPPQTTHLAWIDAGIWKIVKDQGRGAKAMVNHGNVAWPMHKVCIPGCWAAPTAPSSDAICWRFCGGFLVVPVALMGPFYKAVRSVLESWLTGGHVAWEVNIWAALEWQEEAWFTWWGADHNESMLETPSFLATIR